MAQPANYRDDVINKAAAEEALAGAEPRAYITWRADNSDSDFFLSYNSVTFGRTEHVALLRLPDGSFRCLEGLDRTRFPSLGDFIATRSYLQARAGDAPAAPQSGSSLVRRGKADLPRNMPLPLPKAPQGTPHNSHFEPPELPTFSPKVHNLIFAFAGVLAVILGAWCFVEYRAHEGVSGGRRLSVHRGWPPL